MTYWRWFFSGEGDRCPGIRRLFDLWFLVHIAIGVTLAIIVPVSIQEAANTVLLPLAGVLIGLCFAWGGNAQALLQSDEIDGLSDFHPGGYEDYVYVYQSAILIVLSSLVLWGLAGFGIFDKVWPKDNRPVYLVVRIIIFMCTSMAFRECWHVVLGAQTMIIMRQKIRRIVKSKNK